MKLVVPLIDIEEVRYPGHGRKRRWRSNDFVVQDRELLKMHSFETYQHATDLHRLLPSNLSSPFDTKQLSRAMEIPRYDAQRIAYVLRKTGSALQVGKKGNAVLYELAEPVVPNIPHKRRLVKAGPQASVAASANVAACAKTTARKKKTTAKKPVRVKSRTKKQSAA